MSFIDIPPQSELLYNGKWDAAMDKVFIGTLLEQQAIGNWRAGDPNVHAILMAMGTVNLEFGTNISLDDAHERASELENRYLTFKKLVEDTDGTWNQYVNVVNASRNFWRKVFQRSTLARAYFHQGEPEFDALQKLFAPSSLEVTQPIRPGIVVISDGSAASGKHGTQPANTVIVLSSDDSTEVVSPLACVQKTAKKKLLYDENLSGQLPMFEAESTNLIDPFGLAFGASSQDKFNPFLKKPTTKGNPSKKSGASSCASSSPGCAWLKTLK